MEAIQQISMTDVLKRDGGFTYNPRLGQFVTRGFAVSLHKDRELRVPGYATQADFETYILMNADLLRKFGKQVGAWYNEEDGHTWLDVSETLLDEAQVLALAKEHNQVAYFDFKKREVVYV